MEEDVQCPFGHLMNYLLTWQQMLFLKPKQNIWSALDKQRADKPRTTDSNQSNKISGQTLKGTVWSLICGYVLKQ